MRTLRRASQWTTLHPSEPVNCSEPYCITLRTCTIVTKVHPSEPQWNGLLHNIEQMQRSHHSSSYSSPRFSFSQNFRISSFSPSDSLSHPPSCPPPSPPPPPPSPPPSPPCHPTEPNPSIQLSSYPTQSRINLIEGRHQTKSNDQLNLNFMPTGSRRAFGCYLHLCYL